MNVLKAKQILRNTGKVCTSGMIPRSLMMLTLLHCRKLTILHRLKKIRDSFPVLSFTPPSSCCSTNNTATHYIILPSSSFFSLVQKRSKTQIIPSHCLKTDHLHYTPEKGRAFRPTLSALNGLFKVITVAPRLEPLTLLPVHLLETCNTLTTVAEQLCCVLCLF